MPSTKPVRSIMLVRPPGPDGVAVVRITLGKRHFFYAVKQIPCEIGGRGFAMHRLGVAPLYHVRVGRPEQLSCECKGYYRHGHCKHIRGLLALIDAGLL